MKTASLEILTLIGAIYLLSSFIAASFNITHWHTVLRAADVVLFLVVIGINWYLKLKPNV